MAFSFQSIGFWSISVSIILSQLAIGSDEKPVRQFAMVLGVAQDAGYPQANCKKECCRLAWNDLAERRFVSCLAVVDVEAGKRFLFDCTPNFPDQLKLLDSETRFEPDKLLDGIFLTHGHIGHYTGLIHLGREAIGADHVSVFGTSRMNRFLSSNGPWSQLIKLSNIDLKELSSDAEVKLTDNISITPFSVPSP